MGKLYYGAYNSNRKEANVKIIDELLENCKIIFIDNHTSKIYGEIKYDLKINGTPIPENDIWIAALAKQYEFTLITSDIHYKSIFSIEKENWID